MTDLPSGLTQTCRPDQKVYTVDVDRCVTFALVSGADPCLQSKDKHP